MSWRRAWSVSVLGVLVLVVGVGDASAAVRAGSSPRRTAADRGPLTLYSGQHEQTVRALVKGFEQQTGAKVSVRNAGEGDLANQLLQEGSNSPADVYFAANPPALTLVSQRKLFAPVDRATLAAVPVGTSSPRGTWVGVTARSAALVYDTRAVATRQLPSSVLDLAAPAWKGKVALAPSETDFQPVVTAVIKLRGVAAARQWLEGLKANAQIYDSNESVVAAVNRGERAVGLILHYYWYRLREELGGKVNTALHYFKTGDPGALIDISGAGVLKSSTHRKLAQKFLAYLVSKKAQQLIASSQSWEYPLRPGVDPYPGLRAIPNLTPTPVSIAELGDGRPALDLLQQVGLL